MINFQPIGLFYPKGGEVFEAVQDIQINYLTHFMVPYTGGDKAKLLKGERVIHQQTKSRQTIRLLLLPD